MDPQFTVTVAVRLRPLSCLKARFPAAMVVSVYTSGWAWQPCTRFPAGTVPKANMELEKENTNDMVCHRIFIEYNSNMISCSII